MIPKVIEDSPQPGLTHTGHEPVMKGSIGRSTQWYPRFAGPNFGVSCPGACGVLVARPHRHVRDRGGRTPPYVTVAREKGSRTRKKNRRCQNGGEQRSGKVVPSIALTASIRSSTDDLGEQIAPVTRGRHRLTRRLEGRPPRPKGAAAWPK